jgi:hypothetical protein
MTTEVGKRPRLLRHFEASRQQVKRGQGQYALGLPPGATKRGAIIDGGAFQNRRLTDAS